MSYLIDTSENVKAADIVKFYSDAVTENQRYPHIAGLLRDANSRILIFYEPGTGRAINLSNNFNALPAPAVNNDYDDDVPELVENFSASMPPLEEKRVICTCHIPKSLQEICLIYLDKHRLLQPQHNYLRLPFRCLYCKELRDKNEPTPCKDKNKARIWFPNLDEHCTQLDELDIELVQSRAYVCRCRAIATLMSNEGDIVESIIEFTVTK